MYESYWQLSANPFENGAHPGFFYRSETHQASLLKMRYLVEHKKGAGLLVGGTGSGKTYLTQMLGYQLAEPAGPFVSILFPQMSPAELLAYLAVELGADPQQVGGDARGMDRSVREIQQLLRKYNTEGRHPVIVIDEAHLIEDMDVFQALRLLLNFHEGGQQTFTLILAGQRSLLNKTRRIAEFEERLAVKCLLRPLTQDETISYVSHRLQVAGARKAIFDPDALTAVFELSGGIPRRINRICDLSLLVGYADDSPHICAEQVEAVSEELAAVVPD